MRNVSSLYKQTAEDRRDFVAIAEITFADGTKKILGKNDFTMSGNSIIESGEVTSFPVGILVGRRINLSLVNYDDRWSQYDFYGAQIFLQTEFVLMDGSTETLNIGTFTVVTPEAYGETISITAMDDTYKTDRAYSTTLSYPVSAGTALRDACMTCDITLRTTSFYNDGYIIPQAPENLTHRQFIGLIAMIAGGNAVLDEYNRLVIKSYDLSPFEQFSAYDGGVFDDINRDRYVSGDKADGGSFRPWDTGDVLDGGRFGDRDNVHILYQFVNGMTIGVDDVVITGVQLMSTDDDNNDVPHLFGASGYVLSVENQLAAGKEDEVAKLIGEKLVGLRFRPFSGDHIAYPMAEFMDPAYILDRKGNIYQTVLTDVEFTYLGFTALKCSADSPIRNSSEYYGSGTKAIVEARQLIKKERTAREQALEALSKQLASSSGLYMTAEPQPDGSSIYYMHDKRTLQESMIVWKLTAEAFGISTDGGKTYPYGLDATGIAILERVYAIGINADYVNSGAIKISDESGNVVFSADISKKDVEIAGWKVASGYLYKSVNLYPDMTASGLAGVADNSPVQYYVWIRSPKTTDESVFVTSYVTKADYLSGSGLQYRTFYVNFNGHVYARDAQMGGEFNSTSANASTTIASGLLALSYNNVVGGVLSAVRDGLGKNGVMIATPSDFLGLGIVVQSGSSGNQYGSYYYMNNSSEGINGRTERHLFYGSARMATDSLYIWYEPIGEFMTGGSIIWDWDSGLRLNAYDGWICSGASFYAYGDIGCTGQKHRIVDTTHYGKVGLNAFETANPYFSDIGSGRIGNDGTVTIFFDPVFSETVDMECEYQVFLTPTSPDKVAYAEKKNGCFTVYGDPGASFDWMLCVPQRDYSASRLERMTPDISKDVYFDDAIFRKDDAALDVLENMNQNYEKEIELL